MASVSYSIQAKLQAREKRGDVYMCPVYMDVYVSVCILVHVQ
jgi:hypothetical protein